MPITADEGVPCICVQCSQVLERLYSDVIGHEFTHCVTGTTMTTNLYLNDYGAINEAMSDIMGNIIEMSIDDRPDGAWVIGEKLRQV